MAENLVKHQKTQYAIFLPVRNGGLYIGKAIESILAQKVSDFSLIILENKSTDNTLSIVHSYDDKRITVVEAPSGLGICENWKRVYDLIKTGVVDSEFMTITGHDDIFYPNFLETIDGLISNCPDASLYQTHFDIINESGKIKRPCRPIPFRESHKDFFLSRCWGLRDSFGTGYVFRTGDYVKVGGIKDFPLLLGSDIILFVQLAELSYKACAGQSAFAYRLHRNNASHAITTEKFAAQAKAVNRFLSEIEQNYQALIVSDYDKIALGFFLANQLDWLDFPFKSILAGPETSKSIEDIKTAAFRLMQHNTFERLSDANFLARVYSRLRRFYVMLMHCF